MMLFFGCTKDNVVSDLPQIQITDSLAVITGYVKDISGNPLYQAQVYLVNTTGTSTDSSGGYKIKDIVPGSYQMIVSKNGYSNDTSNIIIHYRDSLNMNFQLRQSTWFRMDVYANSLNSNNFYRYIYVNPQLTVFASTFPGAWNNSQSGLMKTSNFGLNWEWGISNGCATKIFKNSDNNLFMFTAKGQDGISGFLGENILYRSNDYGNTWANLVNFNFDQIDGYKIIFTNTSYYLNIYGYNFSQKSSNYFFYKSNNQGTSWSSYSPVNNYNIVSVNKTTSGKVYIRNYSDSLYYTTDGTNWNLRIISDSYLKSYLMNSIILPTGEMLSLGNNFYVISDNDGQSFNTINSNINSNLPYVDRFAFDSRNDIYAFYPGNDYENPGCVYKSSDKCATMQKYEDGLPQYYIISGLYIRDDYAYLLCNGYVYRTSMKTIEQ